MRAIRIVRLRTWPPPRAKLRGHEIEDGMLSSIRRVERGECLLTVGESARQPPADFSPSRSYYIAAAEASSVMLLLPLSLSRARSQSHPAARLTLPKRGKRCAHLDKLNYKLDGSLVATRGNLVGV